jgi:uncharacterized membrane protein YeaQ/YmgE (transglycosylase-associated protein family)
MNMTFGQVVGWIIAGLIVGAVARLLIPGRQEMGIVMTILLGIAGAIVGGLIAAQLFGPPPPDVSVETHWRGWLMSIAGGVLVVGAYTMLMGRRRYW